MFSFKRTLVNTNEANELEYFLNNKSTDYKKRTKEILEGFEVIYIVADGKGINDYEIIKTNEEDPILILTYAEYEELTSKKPLQRIIYSKKVFDLR